MERMRMAATTARSGLRQHRPTSVWLILIAAAGLGAALPVTGLMTWPGGQLSRLRWAAGALGAEQGWDVARTAGALREEALRLLFQALFGVALAAFVVSMVAAVLVFAARAGERSGEITLRRAVGARRRTLLLAAVIEGGLLAIAALVVGGTAGMVFGRAALAAWPGPFAPGATVAAGVTTGMMIGIMLGGAVLGVVFAPGRRLTDALPRPAGLILPSAQLGTALVILTSSALFIQQAASSPAAGRPAGGEVYAGSATLADPGVRATRYASLLQSLKARTRFDSVSLVSAGTVVGLGTVSIATTECGNCPWGGVVVPWHAVATTHRFVSADSFQALAVHVVAGRGIAASDTWDRPRVAVVSRALAERHFQNGDAIGRRMLLGDDRRTWHTVVGIVDDPPTRALGSALLPPFTVYASVLQHPPVNVELLVRRRAGAGPSPEVRSAFALALGGRSGGVRATDERALVAAEVTPLAWFGRLFAAEGWTALAVAGLACAVQMGLWVRSRAPELGLRRAVGASRWQVVALVLARAAAVGGVGTVAGLAFGPPVWSALGTMVAGLPAWDSGLVLRFAAVLVATSTAGGLVPAWRAGRAAPARLLAAG
jgi:putative ABC transport system permease protein